MDQVRYPGTIIAGDGKQAMPWRTGPHGEGRWQNMVVCSWTTCRKCLLCEALSGPTTEKSAHSGLPST